MNTVINAAMTADNHGYCAANGSEPLRAICASDSVDHESCQWAQPKKTRPPMTAVARTRIAYSSCVVVSEGFPRSAAHASAHLGAAAAPMSRSQSIGVAASFNGLSFLVPARLNRGAASKDYSVNRVVAQGNTHV